MAVVTLTEAVSAILTSKADALVDPWPVWRELRETSPVVEADGVYLLGGYAEVKSVLRDDRHFANSSRLRGRWSDSVRAQMTQEQQAAFQEVARFQALTVIGNDDDAHERLRRHAHRAFTPRRIAELKEATVRYVDEVIAELADQGECDLMELAYRVPLMIIGDLLGVPKADQKAIKDWSNAWFEGIYTGDDRIFGSLEAQRNFLAYVEGMIEEHRRKPAATGLIAALMGAEEEEQLTPEELAAMFFILLFAGHETTTNLIGTGMYELLRNRDQWEAICADPDLVPAATEELLRYITPVQWLVRYARTDAEVAGTQIPEGSTVLPVVAAADRDPAVFANPDTLDVRRPNAKEHVALGFGRHFCLGASLARLEGTVAFRALATRYANIELLADEVKWRGAAQLRGLNELRVRMAA